MRIGFVAERMLVGFGVDLAIDQTASRLAERGHDVTVYASAVDPAAKTGVYRLEQIPVRADRVYPRYEMRARRWAEYLDAEDNDVLFIETFPFFSLIPLLRTPVVAMDYGISSTEGMSAPRRAMFAYVRRTQYARYLPKAARIAVISSFLKSQMPARLRERTDVIYLGSDHYPAAAADARTRTREALGVGEDEVLALYVGRINHERQPYKGTADLLRLAPRWAAKSIRLVLAGRPEEGDETRIAAAGALLVAEPSAERLAELYAAADLYVTATRWEGFDLPLVEAQRAGVPGVALRVGAHPEVLRDGETGILADDVEGLARAVEELGGDAQRRTALGRRAAEWVAETFTWERSVDERERIAGEAARPRKQRAEESGNDITAVILNYGAEHDVLERCIRSVEAQTHAVDVLLVDNASPKHRDAIDKIQAEHPDVRQLRLPRNLGFSGGINAGVRAARTPYVLILNNDTEVTPNAVEEMRRVLLSRDDAVGVAPKIMLMADPEVFDAVGNLIQPDGSAFNMGIGQIDIGQYDRVEQTFGACFAATLIRTEAFDPGRVGPLDESYFMYYEDIDWCYRANALGYRFFTAPDAVVLHEHSYSVRSLTYGFKYRHIERNFVRTVAKNFERGRALRAVIRRTLAHVYGILAGRYRKECVRVLLDNLLVFGDVARKRAAIQTRRRVDDVDILKFAHGERPCFDPERYAPQHGPATIEMMYRRKYLVTGETRYKEIADVAAHLDRHQLGATAEVARELLAPLLKDEPSKVQQLLEPLT